MTLYIKRQEALEQAKQVLVLKQKEYNIMCPVFHANKLTTCSEPTINKQKATSISPVQIQGQEK